MYNAGSIKKCMSKFGVEELDRSSHPTAVSNLINVVPEE